MSSWNFGLHATVHQVAFSAIEPSSSEDVWQHTLNHRYPMIQTWQATYIPLLVVQDFLTPDFSETPLSTATITKSDFHKHSASLYQASWQIHEPTFFRHQLQFTVIVSTTHNIAFTRKTVFLHKVMQYIYFCHKYLLPTSHAIGHSIHSVPKRRLSPYMT